MPCRNPIFGKAILKSKTGLQQHGYQFHRYVIHYSILIKCYINIISSVLLYANNTTQITCVYLCRSGHVPTQMAPTMQQLTPTMGPRLRISCWNIATYLNTRKFHFRVLSCCWCKNFCLICTESVSENFKMTSSYRQYKSFVPDYLHDRPRSVIKHCLERKSKS